MATIGSLVVEMSANVGRLRSDFDKANRELSKFSRKTNDNLSSIDRSLGKVAALGRLAGGALAAIGGAQIISSIGRTAAQMQSLEAGLRGVTGSSEAASQTLSQLLNISGQTGASLEGTVRAFQRFSIAAENIGATRDETISLVRTLQQLGAVSGASANDLTNASIQLAQALASGRLQGDELRSVLENLPVVGQILARELGVSIGQLRELGSQGELTADRVFAALQRAGAEAQQRFDELPLTVDRAAASAATAWQRFIQVLDKTLKITESIAATLTAVANSLNSLSDASSSSGYIFDPDKLEENRAQVARLRGELEALDGQPQGRARTRNIQELQAQIDALTARDPVARLQEIDEIIRSLSESPGRGQSGRRTSSNIAELSQEAATLRAELEKARLARVELEAPVAGSATSGLEAETTKSIAKVEQLSVAVAKASKEISDQEEEYRRLGEALTRELRTPTEEYQDELEQLNDLVNAGAISWETYNRGLLEAQERFANASRSTGDFADELKSVEQAGKDVGETIGRAFTIAADGFGRAVTGADSFSDALGRIGQRLVELAIDTTTNTLISALSNSLGGLFQSAFAPAPSLAIGGANTGTRLGLTNPGQASFASGGTLMAGKTALVGEAGPEVVSFGRTGTVIPNSNLDIGGGTTVNVQIVNNAGAEVGMSQRSNSSGGVDLEVTLDQAVAGLLRRPGSQTGRALQNTFGASRALTGR